MKKVFSLLMTSVLLATACIGFTACDLFGGNSGGNLHTSHNWSASYTPDGDRHYQTCNGCNQKQYSDHSYNTDGVCKCGKTKPKDPMTFDELISNHSNAAKTFISTYVRPAVVGSKTVKSEAWSIAAAQDNSKVNQVSILYVYAVNEDKRAVELVNVTLPTPVSTDKIAEGEAEAQVAEAHINRTTVFEFSAQYNYNNQDIITALYANRGKTSDLKLIAETTPSTDTRVAYNYLVIHNGAIDAYYVEVRKGDGSKESILNSLESGYTYNTTKIGSHSMKGTVVKTAAYSYEGTSIPADSVTLDETELTLYVNGNAKLTATVLPANAPQTVSYTVKPAGVVSVDNEGNVTALTKGTAVITATTANGKTATCNVTVIEPLTNAEVLQFLNKKVLIEVGKKFAESHFVPFNANNISNPSWYITKESGKITSADVTFNYIDTTTKFDYVALYKIDFEAPITSPDIKNGEIGTTIFTKIYYNAFNRSIQSAHADLTNAICDKLFGANANATRYIIDEGHDSIDPQLGDSKMFSVIEVTDTYLKQKSIKIASASTDEGMVNNLSNASKYYTYGEEKSHAITGKKLENNTASF